MKAYTFIKEKKDALKAKEEYYRLLLEQVQQERRMFDLYNVKDIKEEGDIDALIFNARNMKSYYRKKINKMKED